MEKLKYFIFFLLAGALASNPALAYAASAGASNNWSGYAVTGGGYTHVEGSWVVPTVSSSALGSDATWVGIGGLTSEDLIQAGTQALIVNGRVAYQAWYEVLPEYAVPVPVVVHAGDSMHTDITNRGGDEWRIVIENETTGDRFAKDLTYESSGSSAEWIEELPLVNDSYIPLADFGSVTFTNASATKAGSIVTPASPEAHPITMYNVRGEALAKPNEPVSRQFTVARTEADSEVALEPIPVYYAYVLPVAIDGQLVILQFVIP